MKSTQNNSKNSDLPPDSGQSNQLQRHAKRGWIWGATEQFAQRGLTLLVSLVLVRLLEPSTFGMIASVSIFFATAQRLIDGGISSRIIQKKNISNEDYNAFFWCNGLVSLIICGSLILCSGLIAEFLGKPELQTVVRVISIAIFFMFSGRTQECKLVREFRFKTISVITIISVFAGSCAGLLLAFRGFGIWAILGQQLIVAVARSAGFWILVSWQPQCRISWAAVKDLYAFGMPILVSQTIRGFSEQFINLITARTAGMAVLGYYDRGRFIPNTFVNLMQNTFFRANFTVLSKLQERRDEFRTVYLNMMKVIGLVCLFTMTGFTVCAPEIVEVLLGIKWLPSVWFLQMGCIMSTMLFMFLINLEVLKAVGAVSIYARQNIIFAVFQLIGVGCGFAGGVEGMVIGAAIAGICSWLLVMLAVGRVSHIRVRDQFRVFIVPVMWCAAAAVVLWSVRQIQAPVVVRFGLCAMAGAAFFGAAWFFQRSGTRRMSTTTA